MRECFRVVKCFKPYGDGCTILILVKSMYMYHSVGKFNGCLKRLAFLLRKANENLFNLVLGV